MSKISAVQNNLKEEGKSFNDLRTFRLSKQCELGKRIERVPGAKRIQMIADSDSDDLQSPKKLIKSDAELSLKEKEQRFLATVQLMPQYDTMVVQDALLQNNWNTTAAIKFMREHCTKKFVRSNGASRSDTTKHSSRKRFENSNASSDEDYSKGSKKQVYDSSDSDNESSQVMTHQRKKVFEFMNTATLIELQTVKTLSEKKALKLIEMRPFRNWNDLCVKLRDLKQLNTDLLNHTQDLINKQNNVANILEKCEKMVKRIECAVKAGAGITEQPTILNKNMKLAEYQLIGLNWLAVMFNEKMNAVLADEMGLGKTIQVIAFLAYLKENNLSKGAHLIVVPSSTLDNWEHEINVWCPSLKVERYYGNQEERKRMRIRYSKEGFTGFDILLSTYHVVYATPEEKKMFRVCSLHYVIFDEAHMLKNMTTQRYINLFNIKAECRILLTGTPLQNNLLELMSLCCFVMPSVFSKNMDDIKSLFIKRTKVDDEAEEASQFLRTQVEHAKNIMQPFFLRRLKKDVLKNLPKKHTFTQKIPMTENQKEIYKGLIDYYSNMRNSILEGERNVGTIMMDMRKAANHPLLLRNFFTDHDLQKLSKRLAVSSLFKKTNPDYIFEELAILSDFQVWELCQKYGLKDVHIPDNLICDSGKFVYLDTLLPKLKEEGHRVLLFSQFTKMLDILEQYLELRSFSYCRLDGATAVDERIDLINDFNNDSEVFIFLLSTRAGGIGINLTAADTCIIHDIDFNPYNDKQAEDRCHRMGQKREVTIYRLVSEGTIEDGMQQAAEEKLQLEQNITSADKNNVQEQKCVVSLLTRALGLDKEQEEILNNSINKSLNMSSTPQEVEKDSD